VDHRQRWQALQAQLTIARTQLDADDPIGALAAVDQALALDPDFLAAQALRERILSISPAALLSATRPARIAPPAPPVSPVPPAAIIPAPIGPVVTADSIPDVVVEAAQPPVAQPAPAAAPLVSAEGYARFEQRAKRRRADRRLDAAKKALEAGKVKDASAALDEVIELDPNLPEIAELTAQFELLRQSARPSHRGRWLAAAAVFGGIVLGASWLQESNGLLSRPVVTVGPLVTPPEPFGATVVASETSADLDSTATTGDFSTTLPAANSSATQRPAETFARRVEPAVDDRRQPEVVTASLPAPSTAPPSAMAAPIPVSIQTPPPIQRPNVESSGPLAPVTTASVPVMPPPAPAPAASTTASAVVPMPDDESLVKQALQRYRTAYEGLDARSARAVWPAVNVDALARAFNGLESQALVFDACDVRLRGDAANATCRGSARYVTKVGNHEPRTEPRTWMFTLKKNGTDWKIESARAER
jgi:tetratricopeptide (TPR) repeat protein